MTNESSNTHPGQGDKASAPRVDIDQDDQLHALATKLDASPEQIKDAVKAVGNLVSDVEEHLKGSRSITNADRVRQAGAS